MITDKTLNCAFFAKDTEKCKIYNTKCFDCSHCMAFHVYEKAPHKDEEPCFIPSDDEDYDD